MSKSINSTVESIISTRNFPGVLLCKLYFTPVLRYSNSYQSIYWDESGSGEVEYVGLGNLASISTLGETSELAAQTIELKLSGIPASIITDVFSTEYIGKPVYLWYGVLDPDTYAVEQGQDGPVLIFAGRMDFADIEFGKTCEITIHATNRLADWERARGGRFNESYQRHYIDPTDDAFNYVQAMQNKPITWGAFTASDPGTAYPPIYRPQCFAGNTEFIMHDKSIKQVKDIEPGDKMYFGGLVLGTHKGHGLVQHWYDYKGIKVSGAHLVFNQGIWTAVENRSEATPIDPEEYTYSVTNENNIMISKSGIIFNDFEMVAGGTSVHNNYRKDAIHFLNNNYILNRELEQLKL